ncbi:MAG TPA: GTP-binding protein [Bryobacteraceae bacterium]|nr:GTP-binding protein [Bryobacteraceae bacterium]
MSAPHLILVGGFLGAGKTTLLLAAGSRLRAAGKRVGIILNDQGGELVDTRLAEAAGFPAREITGGCFCCRFSEFVRAAGSFAPSEAPEFILAEPVGSCTDLAATILQPLRRYYGDRYKPAPLTVLADPARAGQLMGSNADPLVSYLFHKQIAEADLVRFSKADLHTNFPRFPGVDARPLSAQIGLGVADWLHDVLSWDGVAGAKLLDIDYSHYAEAEASLGWLNRRGELRLDQPLTPAAVIGPFVTRLDRLLTDGQVPIAHLKVFAQSANGHLKASVCRNGERPTVAGTLDAPPAARCTITINLRASGDPAILSAFVDQATRELPGRFRIDHAEAFRPSPPVPEHRFKEAI